MSDLKNTIIDQMSYLLQANGLFSGSKDKPAPKYAETPMSGPLMARGVDLLMLDKQHAKYINSLTIRIQTHTRYYPPNKHNIAYVEILIELPSHKGYGSNVATTETKNIIPEIIRNAGLSEVSPVEIVKVEFKDKEWLSQLTGKYHSLITPGVVVTADESPESKNQQCYRIYFNHCDKRKLIAGLEKMKSEPGQVISR